MLWGHGVVALCGARVRNPRECQHWATTGSQDYGFPSGLWKWFPRASTEQSKEKFLFYLLPLHAGFTLQQEQAEERKRIREITE